MSSSSEQAMLQLRKWVAANPRPTIRASFKGSGLWMRVTGFVALDEEKSQLFLVSDSDIPLLTISLSLAIPCEHFEPLLDASEKDRFKMDFLVSESFRLPCGTVDLYEIAG
jgi:hypothetical protein